MAVLAACTPAPSGAPASPASPASSPSTSAASPASPTSPDSTSAPAASPSPTASPSRAAADVVTIQLTIKDGRVTPNAEKINVRQGQTVALAVTSDADDEVHAHTGSDDFELEVRPGTTRGQFVAEESGTYEVELHQLEKVVAILVVR